ncbi:hypothetical protein [Citrobacter sp. NCU1]|uniref:hypothetical protein n=1 Tax=Citrobacter sp. NCU1 TaxID=2026683 RepID=UPI0013910514|nr:hypothetical protein [Citrobacter sp. NCU1]
MNNMIWFLFHGICALIFSMLSLSNLADIVLHYNEYQAYQITNKVGLGIGFSIAWVWAVNQALESWHIYKSR